EIRHEDLKLVSELLGTPFSTFQDLARHVDAVPSVLRKYSEEVDHLSSRPVVLLDEYDTARLGKVLLPCPWKFLRAAREFLLFDFFVHLDANAQAALAGRNAFSLRGEAFHSFLRETFKSAPAVVDCDRLKGVSGLHPDFVW